ncbi:hypothetical protein BT93_H1642 [Corymbia citriodora subsp. variegata]|nr:hypothetical protein BT93_H1642 [Corymbia citriodora subsp. variegata]
MSSLPRQDHPQELLEDDDAQPQLQQEEGEEHDEVCLESMLAPRLGVLSRHFSTAAPANPMKRGDSLSPSLLLLQTRLIRKLRRRPAAPSSTGRISTTPSGASTRSPSRPLPPVSGTPPPVRKNCGGFGADNTGFTSPEKLVFGVNPATVTTPSPARGSSSSSLLPKPPLQRTASELASYQTSGSISSFSRGSSSSGGHGSAEESPNSKRLKTTKRCLKEMRRWWDHAMREACEDNEPDERGNTDTTEIVQQGKREEAEEEENHEAVSMGVIHDCLSLDFNCPCGKGYQIVLSGNKCYYKLV